MTRLGEVAVDMQDVIFYILGACAVGYVVVFLLIYMDSRTGLLDPMWRAFYRALLSRKR